MDPKTSANQVLSAISEVLTSHYTQQQDFPGVLSGYTGAALFFAYYAQYTGEQRHQDFSFELLERSITAMSEEAMILTHCTGISGICWTIQHFINQGFADQEGMEDIFEDVNDMLGSYMREELAEGQCDFLHQGLGAALYFLERPVDEISTRYLTEAVDLLAAAATEFPDGISWKDNFSKTSMQLSGDAVCYNLGLAHGVPAILVVLALIYAKGIAQEEAGRLLEGGVRWLLATRNPEVPANQSLFPVIVDPEKQAYSTNESRLGWCYGDLGIGITLLNIGHLMHNELYKSEGLAILRHIAAHRDAANGGINDACLCHGSAGVSHIFRRAYQLTQDAAMLAGAEHWLEEALRADTHEDGAAGYKFFAATAYENSYNLLEGISGIGLAILASQDTEHAPDWDRSLLIS